MKKAILSLMKIYSLKKVLIKENDKMIDLIILNRDKILNLNDWINLDIALKSIYKKKINYLDYQDAKYIYKNDLTEFKEVDYE